MSMLSNLKATHLRALLTQIGAKSSGTKPQLLARLQRELGPESQISKHGTGKHEAGKQRILSVDMGIKNLAFCVAEPNSPSPTKDPWRIPPLQMHITAWRRISVLQSRKPPNASPSAESPDPSDAEDDVEPFAPKALSTTAYALVKDLLLPHSPTTILIERQRFRSANQPSVQEWTLRVNLLEGMIWAVLRSLGYRDGVVPRVEVESVSPARVAGLWVPDKGRVEKEDKIAVVKGWLEGGGKGEEEGEARLSFGEEARGTSEAFLEKVNGRGRRRKVLTAHVEGLKEVDGREDVGKVDDLADCLLQAAAWVRWRGNWAFLRRIWGDEERVRQFAENKTSG